MKTFFAAVLFIGVINAHADSSYYCNGSYKKSGDSWYYPTGSYAQSGSSTYYPTGSYFRSSESMYYASGSYLKSGSSMYYPSGSYLKTGTSFYYPSGSYLKSGSTCYYETGSFMGECPRIYNIDLENGDYDLSITFNLYEGTIEKVVFRTQQFSGNNFILITDSVGSVVDISYSCESSSPEVTQILNLYSALSTDKKSQVRTQMCGQ